MQSLYMALINRLSDQLAFEKNNQIHISRILIHVFLIVVGNVFQYGNKATVLY